MTEIDVTYMKRALERALKGVGWASPNPMVGAVVVKDGAIIGEGYHHRCGEAHAEVNALDQAADAARDATLYLTLEPCSHFGKTPPCVDRVLASGVSRVVVAQEDPNPKVAGRSIAKLRENGVEVEVGCLEFEAMEMNECFRKWIVTGIPFVHSKIAMSLDGRVATHQKDSKWITNEFSRQRVHWMRALYDAILVGVGTVVCDDPMLNCRLPEEGAPWRQPLRVILDPRESISVEAKVVQTTREIPTLLVLAQAPQRESEWNRLGLETFVCPTVNDGVFDLSVLLKELGSRKITGVMVEGGGQTFTSFHEQGLVDKYTFFIAPKLVGGECAPCPIMGKGIVEMKDASTLKNIKVERFGDDTAVTGYC